MDENVLLQALHDEKVCRENLRQWRERHGIACRLCASSSVKWQPSLVGWTCARCGIYTSLRHGSCFSESRIPCHLWIRGLFVLQQCAKTPSAIQFQAANGLVRYATARRMLATLVNVPKPASSNFDDLAKALYSTKPREKRRIN